MIHQSIVNSSECGGKRFEVSKMENGNKCAVKGISAEKKRTNHPVFNNDILCDAWESARVPRPYLSLPFRNIL